LALYKANPYASGFLSSFRCFDNELYQLSLSILINGATSPFFNPERGLRQGCPLSPLLFLLFIKGLSKSLKEAIGNGSYNRINVGNSCYVTHFLFVDDILILCEDSRRVVEKLKEIIDLFYMATSMKMNMAKSTTRVFLRGKKYLSPNCFPTMWWN
jgi:hypothetical protein